MKAKRISDAAPESGRQNRKPGKTRLDVAIVERGLAPSRERAQAILLAGNVLVNGQKMEKPGTQIAADASIEIIGEALRVRQPRRPETRRRTGRFSNLSTKAKSA